MSQTSNLTQSKTPGKSPENLTEEEKKMSEKMLELTYKADIDENDIFNGLELARDLIRDAYQLLAPYAALCPACTDTLFSHVANRALDDIHKEESECGKLPSLVMHTGEKSPEERHAAFDAHARAFKEMLHPIFAATGDQH